MTAEHPHLPVDRAAPGSVADVIEPRRGGEPSAWLSAIVHNSFDAILSKTLDGVITSWNEAAERMFGFSAEEAIGQSITIIIPADRLDEETAILAQLRRGEAIERFETVRRNRDGRPLDIELSVSPVCDPEGNVVGASKIARDITERKRLAEQQTLLIREMHHRIKNLLAVVQSLIGLSRRNATSMEDFAADVSDRLLALSAAHQLILVEPDTPQSPSGAMFDEIVQAVLKPYLDARRTRFDGCKLRVGRTALTTLALLLHELATNAVKHGALSNDRGSLAISAVIENGTVRLVWREQGGQSPEETTEGFGSGLLRVAARALGSEIVRHWETPALTIAIDIPLEKLKH